MPRSGLNVSRRILQQVFPETESSNGIIESPVTTIPKMKAALANQ